MINEELYSAQDLTALCENRKQNAALFQEKIIDSLTHFEPNAQKTGIFIEHTPIETISFFTSAYARHGYISDYALQHLRTITNASMKKNSNCAYIYIVCKPEQAKNNLTLRRRDGEKTLPDDVLETLNSLMLNHMDNNSCDKLVLDYEYAEQHTKKIIDFLMKIESNDARYVYF